LEPIHVDLASNFASDTKDFASNATITFVIFLCARVIPGGPAGVDYMPTAFSCGVASQPQNGGKNAPRRSLYG
jgi:hypothetical protein